jgi:hypothetical protein
LLGIEDAKLFDVGFGANGFGEIGPFVFQFEVETHGLGGDEDVRENDNGVDAQAAERLDGDFQGEIGSLANLQEGVFSPDFAVLRKVSAGLAHHPDGETRDGFAAAGAEEEFFSGEIAGSLGSHMMRAG